MPEGKKFNFLHTNPLTPYQILPISNDSQVAPVGKKTGKAVMLSQIRFIFATYKKKIRSTHKSTKNNIS